MKLDASHLAAEADAHEERRRSPAWADPGNDGENWTATLTKGVVEDASAVAPQSTLWTSRPSSRPTPEPSAQAAEILGAPSPVDLGEITAQLDAMGRTLRTLSEGMARLHIERPASVEDVPTWLQQAAGDPLTYDAPDPSRKTVCVRVLPASHARLQQVQDRLGLRTAAGAWEYLLRLGAAAAERLPTR